MRTPPPEVLAGAELVDVTPPARPMTRSSLRTMMSRPLIALGGLALLLLVLVAVLAPWITPYDPLATNLTRTYEPPSGDHWLGTDQLGRDLLSRVIAGTRVSMLAAAQAIGLAVAIGLPLGLLAGYVGGALDTILSRINDALMSVPGLVLAIAVVAVLGPGLTRAMLAVGIVASPWFFRVIRGATMNVREETFIEAAVGLGCSTPRILVRHVLSNILSPLLVQVTFALAWAVIAEATLSFLGLGVQLPTPSWGGMLQEASRRLDIEHLLYGPAVALVFAVTVFTVLGDAWRDAIGSTTRNE